MKYRHLLFKCILLCFIQTACNPKEPKNIPLGEDHDVTIDSSLIKPTMAQSFTYIDWVSTSPNEQESEGCVELFFQRPILTLEQYESLTPLGDEKNYLQVNPRNILSLQHAKTNFDLRGLDSVWMVDQQNSISKKVSHLKHFEYLDKNISPEFVAVYDLPEKDSQIVYCVGGMKPTFSKLQVQHISDSTSSATIDQYFKDQNIELSYTNDHRIYRVNDSLLLIFSNTNSFSFIHLQLPKTPPRLVYQTQDTSNLSDLQIIPILNHDVPVLLCKFFAPDSDVFWSQLLMYNGEKYIDIEHQRIQWKDSIPIL